MRIVFFGTPEFAVPSLDALLASPHQVVGTVTQPDRPRGRGQRVTPSPVKARAEEAGLPVEQPERMRDAAFMQTLREWAPDLGVVAAYGKLLPEALIAVPRLGLINVHASLLPKYRGAAPIQRAVMAGDAETGVTIMRIVKALDAGAMFNRGTVPIGPDDTSVEIERALATLGGRLLIDAVEDLDRGLAVETPQDDARATYASRILKTDGIIDWERPAAEIHNQVRGLHPWPHAYTYLETTRYVIHQTRPFASRDELRAELTAEQRELFDRAAATHLTGAAATTPTATQSSTAFAASASSDAAEPASTEEGAAASDVVIPYDSSPSHHADGHGIVLLSRARLIVSAGSGSVLEILRLQEDGRRAITAREYLAGRTWPIGARLHHGAPV